MDERWSQSVKTHTIAKENIHQLERTHNKISDHIGIVPNRTGLLSYATFTTVHVQFSYQDLNYTDAVDQYVLTHLLCTPAWDLYEQGRNREV